MTLALDKPGAMLIGVAALLWMTAGAYAGNSLRGKPNAGGFRRLVADDADRQPRRFPGCRSGELIISFTLASLSAYGLVVNLTALRRQSARPLFT